MRGSIVWHTSAAASVLTECAGATVVVYSGGFVGWTLASSHHLHICSWHLLELEVVSNAWAAAFISWLLEAGFIICDMFGLWLCLFRASIGCCKNIKIISPSSNYTNIFTSIFASEIISKGLHKRCISCWTQVQQNSCLGEQTLRVCSFGCQIVRTYETFSLTKWPKHEWSISL